jgi:hypothetical protein
MKSAAPIHSGLTQEGCRLADEPPEKDDLLLRTTGWSSVPPIESPADAGFSGFEHCLSNAAI